MNQFRFQAGRNGRLAAGTRRILLQARQPQSQEALTPAGGLLIAYVQRRRDLQIGLALGGQQNEFGSLNLPGWKGTRFGPLVQGLHLQSVRERPEGQHAWNVSSSIETWLSCYWLLFTTRCPSLCWYRRRDGLLSRGTPHPPGSCESAPPSLPSGVGRPCTRKRSSDSSCLHGYNAATGIPAFR